MSYKINSKLKEIRKTISISSLVVYTRHNIVYNPLGVYPMIKNCFKRHWKRLLQINRNRSTNRQTNRHKERHTDNIWESMQYVNHIVFIPLNLYFEKKVLNDMWKQYGTYFSPILLLGIRFLKCLEIYSVTCRDFINHISQNKKRKKTSMNSFHVFIMWILNLIKITISNTIQNNITHYIISTRNTISAWWIIWYTWHDTLNVFSIALYIHVYHINKTIWKLS